MLAPVWFALLSGCLLVPGGANPAGYLVPPSRDASVQARAVPYVPREGDLIFYDERNPIWDVLFAQAGSGPPTHMGIIVKKADGRLGLLEAGPDDGPWVEGIHLLPRYRLQVELLPIGPRLRKFQHDFNGVVTVRRCKVTLSAERSRALTAFAKAQVGKPYAVLRFLIQGTPLRPNGPLEPVLGKTQLDRSSWICAELAVAAGTVAGLFDPERVKSNATYPRDLVDNRRHDLAGVWEDASEWRPSPTAVARPAPRPAPPADRK